MTHATARRVRELRSLLRQNMLGPQALAFLPAIVLSAFWIGGESWLILVALGVPALYALTGIFRLETMGQHWAQRDGTTGLPLRRALEQAMDDHLDMAAARGRETACFLLEIDSLEEIADRYGRPAAEEVLARSADRLRDVLRSADMVCRLRGDGFGIGLAPVMHLDLEIAIQLASRLQSAIEEPIAIGATRIYVSCSLGFCLGARAPERSGLGVIHGAERALDEARRNAPSALRAFSDGLAVQRSTRGIPAQEVGAAFEAGQIQPFFQPQISTDTGRVTGFEVLARWHHPDRGLISPEDFLPLVERTGQMERLSELMLTRGLAALRGWDGAGLNVPSIGVNFSATELHDPKLIEKVTWQLDRFDIAPHRLAVEVLETVIAATPDDVVARNINGLARLGCTIDLDDFGTGHASISSIRRFAVSRIKIDRSFVMKVDRDPEQQKMVAAVLTMCERLDLEAVAEGVETRGEHAMLAQLGCAHVQGFGIGRPMPVERTADWVRKHEAGLSTGLRIGRGTG